MRPFPIRAQMHVPPGTLEMGYLGQVSDMAARSSGLPSSDSALAVIRGEKNAWGRVVVSTALRALLIMPGVAFAGARGRELVMGSVLSSMTITAFIFFFYGAKCDGGGSEVQPPQ